MSRQSLSAFQRKVTVDFPGKIEAEAKRLLVKTALAQNEQVLQEQQSRMGLKPDVEAYANRPGQPDLNAVELPGPIVFRYDYRREIVLFALNALRDASPVESGTYRDAHTVYVNGQPVDRLPARLLKTDEIMIVNTVPYARRLEIGKTKSGRSFVLKVDDRIYERTAKSKLIARYRSVASITFGYVSLPSAYKAKGKLSSHYGTGKAAGARGGGKLRKRDQRGESVRFPAIFVEAIR